MAVAGRARLSEGDQALLNAFEPLLSSDPPDMAEHLARLRRPPPASPVMRAAALFAQGR
jgi:hypothetical protein